MARRSHPSSPDELAITQEQTVLTVTGQKAGEDMDGYLHRGIADRSFQLADHVKLTGAELLNEPLTIDLRHEIPEEMKPHRIEIAAKPETEPKQLETGKEVARGPVTAQSAHGAGP
ncbi:heat-shock protein Hsp20 [Paracoccus sp. (in: a-proteobacteria)]|jgi:molecular chaperone IbpA|uniref:heat-shock protein Hsp20 n=1 Tax=Paracoccus sp. TaxID=267 RepID=UPI00258AF531|nr:heat-shock protein Hsp20 [Paracoccus sp. (in: a-proteobacteria)]